MLSNLYVHSVVEGRAPDAWSAMAMAVFDVNGLLLGAGEGIARPLGQSSARWQVLGRSHQPHTVAELARDIGLARQSVQRVADVLVDEGLLAYHRHPTDRRTKLIQLTPAGHAVVLALYQRQSAWADAILTKLDVETLSSASAALERIAEVLREDLEANQNLNHDAEESE